MTAAAPQPLSDRARGWLRHLWRKAMTPDDWSESGDPHPWWDRKSVEPMLSFPRFDLSASSYAMLLMARRTPAWREAYTRILAAASVGCALSRARTGMRADEMTAALPGAALDSVVSALESAVALDRAMARYAAADAKRFG